MGKKAGKRNRILNMIKAIIINFVSLLCIPIVFLAALISSKCRRNYDIGIGPVPLINSVYLKKALEQRGYSVQTYVSSVYYITCEFDVIMDGNLYKIFPFLRVFPILFKYKCLYLYFDGGVLAQTKIYCKLEPLIYKLAKIKIVVTSYGSDCILPLRTPNIYFKNALFQDYSSYYKYYQNRVAGQISRWCKYADSIIAVGDEIEYLPYWNYARTSVLSVDLDRMNADCSFTFERKDAVSIVHAPNHFAVKGTSFVENAIKKLKNEGYKINYVQLHGMTNSDVLKEIKKADIVIDQLILGWHGIFALEGMAFAKPVITHIRKDILTAYEEIGCIEKDELPLIDATPTTIYFVLKDLIQHRDKLKQYGERSLAYVKKYHSIEVIGEYFDKINKNIGLK